MFKFKAHFHATPVADSDRALLVLKDLVDKQALGFVKSVQDESGWKSVQARLGELRSRFETLVVIGIGGSSLGPQAIVEAFEHPQNSRKVFFLDNLDPIAFEKLMKRIEDPFKTAWLISSKSGGTLETLVGADYVLGFFKNKSEILSQNFTVLTTLDKNPLHSFALENKISVLEIPKDVGGRYSVLTPVGMLPAGFLGLHTDEFREGALRCLGELKPVADMVAQILASFRRGEWITQFWFYSSELRTFGHWLQQLWAESLGKKSNLRGAPAPRASTPMVAVGACDQHSILQQVMEGARDKYVVIHRLTPSETGPYPLEFTHFSNQNHLVGKTMGQILAAEAVATQSALNQCGVSTSTLNLSNLDPQAFGFLFMFWQLVVVGVADALEINAFDQPGVELGKRLAKEELSRR